MTGIERVNIESRFTDMIRQALNENEALKKAINNCNEMGYAISFSFINGMCWTTLDTKKNTLKKVMED